MIALARVSTSDPFAAKTFMIGVLFGILLGAPIMERMWFLVTRHPWPQQVRSKRQDRRGRWS